METKNILEVKDLTKIYPGGILANYNVNFGVREGEIHALVGENGAGKSTLMKMLFGMEDITSGSIWYRGEEVRFTSSHDAIAHGIGMVHQHFMLVPSLSAAENLTLGIEPSRGILVDRKKQLQVSQELAEKFRFNIDMRKLVRDLSVGTKQKLEILKVLYRGAKIIILDEPTAVLTPQETEELFENFLHLKDLGYTIIFISHKLDEVKYLSDRITVLRQGRTMGTYQTADVTTEEISKLMVGHDIQFVYDREPHDSMEKVLEVKGVSYTDKFGVKKLDDLNFSLRRGEILGIAGVEGNGQSECVNIITGMLRPDGGKVLLKGTDITDMNVRQRRSLGMACVHEDRLEDGCAPDLSLRDNLISISSSRFKKKNGLLDRKQISEFTEDVINEYSILCSNDGQTTRSLSGGNIQKAIVGRELSSNSEILVINQPTRGIDVGSIEFIHRILLRNRAQGWSILLVSSDLSELIGLSDRIIVFYEGKVTGQIEDTDNVKETDLGRYMLGIKKDSPEDMENV